MYILGFETTGPLGSVGIINLGTGEIEMRVTSEPMSHLKNVAALAEELLDFPVASLEVEGDLPAGGEKVRDRLVAVASSIGPGSFTGIRIGVTLARAVAQALDVPLIAVPTLELFKEKCQEAIPAISAIINARRGQVYGAVYDGNGNVLLNPGPYMLSDVLAITDGIPGTVFYGDGVDAYGDILEGNTLEGKKSEGKDRVFAPKESRYQMADMVVRLAAEKYKSGEILRTPMELKPDYMRLAEAEQKLKDGTLAKLREEKMARFIKNI